MDLRGRRLTTALVAGVVVVLVLGSSAALLIGRHHAGTVASSDQASGSQPSTSRPTGQTSSGSTSADSPTAAGAAASSGAAARGSAAPSDPMAPPAGPSNDLTVQMSPAARGNANSAGVQQLLQGYFDSINRHDYASWKQLVTASMVAGQPRAQWLQAYATTVDSSIWIQSISDHPLQVKLHFTSQQEPELAPRDLKVDCIHWTLVYRIAVQDGQLAVGSTGADSVAYAKCD